MVMFGFLLALLTPPRNTFIEGGQIREKNGRPAMTWDNVSRTVTTREVGRDLGRWEHLPRVGYLVQTRPRILYESPPKGGDSNYQEYPTMSRVTASGVTSEAHTGCKHSPKCSVN
ncbi:hypothetical protein BV898_01562 [Hypsibius exemplaris]|uniref:Uncharacterized protein n=1 Tax=Hypsibius exemplaris TaxID=2072580 RepID=A0A1W0XAR7_HYPEX|nr:hypothetical protein BV898_01562 [Hypsibius exemplaris]